MAVPCLRRDLPKLTQEEFDEAVRTNIEDFDMEPGEAVTAAVEEFTLQNYDMGCVVKTAAGKELANHPVALATAAINEASAAGAPSTSALDQLLSALDDAAAAGPETLQELSAIALRCGSLAAVLRSLQVVTGKPKEGAEPAPTTNGNGTAHNDDSSSLVKALIVAAQRLMAITLDIRDQFDDVDGPETVIFLHTQYAQDLAIQVELAKMAECACFKEEQNKEQLMLQGYGLGLVDLLCRDPTTLTEEMVASASGVLRALCTADDERPPTSKAFQHARLLAHENQALQIMLALLKGIMAGWALNGSPPAGLKAPQSTTTPSTPDSSAPTVAAMLACIRQLAASEEICKAFLDEGGVLTVLALIERLHSRQHREVVRAGLGALRQLSNSDGTKTLLASHDAPTTLLRCVAMHPGDEEITEPILAVLASMTLRQPDICTQCVESGVVDWAIECLTDMADRPLVCRQACILMRNMVVRNPEIRPIYLEKGAEALVRAAKAAHPPNCKDVGYAALRDLGLDNYTS